MTQQVFTATGSPSASPVHVAETGSDHDSGSNPEAGTALCLSGGGYRAMLFHAGALWRLYEAGQLKGMRRISSVSGGSITAALLGLKWKKLSFQPAAVRSDFVPEVVKPIRDLADETIDADAVIGGILSFGKTIADKVTGQYREHLYGKATLQDLPDDAAGPRFVINATNVQSGVLWRFSRPFMGDYRVGLVRNPDVQLAVAVAASSAFPPVLSPLQLKVEPDTFEREEGNDLHEKPYTSRVVLSDGGVYDNLGLETAWKRFTTVLVSDGGGAMSPEAEPKEDWARHSYRVLSLVDSQVRSLRKRQLIDSFKAGTGPTARKGTYWGIRSDVADYRLQDPLPCPFERTLELAKTPTRLKRLPDERQEQLINWGYAVCDTALRKHMGVQVKGAFPYPGVGV